MDTQARRLRIWLIEDDLDLLAALMTALRREGHHVIGTSDASWREGSREPRPHLGVDLLILDERLPSGRGSDALSTLRRDGYRGGALLTSAYVDAALQRAAARLSPCALLSKPFTLEHLLRSVEALA